MDARTERRLMSKANKKWPSHLVLVPRNQWPSEPPPLMFEVWRSSLYLVQLHYAPESHLRVSVCRTVLTPDGYSWQDGISWDELQSIKRQVGLGDRDAFEVYPADRDVVNVANMRHLWVPPEPLAVTWREPSGR